MSSVNQKQGSISPQPESFPTTSPSPSTEKVAKLSPKLLPTPSPQSSALLAGPIILQPTPTTTSVSSSV